MPDDPNPVPIGSTGNVTFIKSHGSGQRAWIQIGVDRDNGRSLMLVVPPDEFEMVPSSRRPRARACRKMRSYRKKRGIRTPSPWNWKIRRPSNNQVGVSRLRPISQVKSSLQGGSRDMRIPHRNQRTLDCTSVTQVVLNPECRAPMIPILRGLQHLYSRPQFRRSLGIDCGGSLGRRRSRARTRGHDLVADFGPGRGPFGLQPHVRSTAGSGRESSRSVGNHASGSWEETSFDWRRIRDNICQVRPETIDRINELIVAEGHRLEPQAAERVRGDSFVAETNIHWPTESSLILDGLTKILK